MDPPLAKAEPISDTHQRYCCETNNSADPQVTEEGGGGGAPGTGAEIPLQPVGKTMVRQAVPLQPMEDPMLEQVDAQRRL